MQRRGFSLFDALVVIGLLAVLLTFAGPALFLGKQRSQGPRCSSGLRQIGLAALQYSDDKRFLPHVGATRTLDGTNASSDTPRAVRATVWYGYHDNPEGFVCSASDDFSLPVTSPEVHNNMRLWGWEGYAPFGSQTTDLANTTPPWRDQAIRSDPTLLQTTELSYAYTRRGYNRNVVSTKVLGADRGVRTPQSERGSPTQEAGDFGNHRDGWNVLYADATVSFVDAGAPFGKPGGEPYVALSGEAKDEAALPISQVARPLP